MRKRSAGPLSLHKETLRNLSARELERAAGAYTEILCTFHCTVSCGGSCDSCPQDPFTTEGTACCY